MVGWLQVRTLSVRLRLERLWRLRRLRRLLLVYRTLRRLLDGTYPSACSDGCRWEWPGLA